jgi:PAS domain S-box-containing protein
MIFFGYGWLRIAPIMTPQDTLGGVFNAPMPGAWSDEGERASVLAAFGYDALFDDAELTQIAEFAARLCDAPVALVSMVEAERQRFLVRSGFDALETPRSQSFCAYAMLGAEPMVVPDATQDSRFRDNPLVTGPPHIRFYAGAPLVSEDGVPLGALCVIDPVARPGGLGPLQLQGLKVLARAVMGRLEARRTDRARYRRASESARAMREIADMVPSVVWAADGEGNFEYFNSRWSVITGCAPPVSASDWRPLIHPDDVDRTFAKWEKSISRSEPFECEYRLKQADGSWRWTLSRALPVHDSAGRVTRWHGTLTDIDEGHRRSENRDLLARELSHRIKNIFAVVAGLVSLRARRAPEAAQFARELIDTIGALGRAHDFVRPMEGIKGDNLRGLLTELMAPYADDNERITITGDDCAIGPRAATPLALTFHELATNSAKYGALAVDGGSISIAVDCPDAGERARIEWREHGGPMGQNPGEEGFGSRLMRSSIEGQLGGKIERRFLDSGLEVDLTIPLAAIRS